MVLELPATQIVPVLQNQTWVDSNSDLLRKLRAWNALGS
jgi:hypothetical protein